jgi:hypothetical protein
MRWFVVLACASCAFIPRSSLADRYVLAADSINARVALLSATDGSVVNANFIVDGAGLNYDMQSPRNAMRVGDEIWVTDQAADSIFRFTLNGKWLGTIGGAIDNVRGMELINNTVYVSNFGSANGAPGPSIVKFSMDGTNLGSIATSGAGSNPMDVLANGSGWLVSDLDADSINRFTDAGYVGGFVNSTPTNLIINAPQQMARRTNGGLLVAGLSTPSGVYLFDSAGQFQQRLAAGRAPNGVLELNNGQFLYSRADGFYRLDPATDVSTAVLTGGGTRGQYLEFVELPEPTGALLIGIGVVALLRRIR